MGRHKKSKKNVIQVNPDATINYVSGILTGANNYISGLLEGANQYNAWVQTEMGLEGEQIGDYKPDSLRKYLEDFKKENPNDYARFMADPYAFLSAMNPAQREGFINHLLGVTNYGRLAKTDELMIKAGKQYREQLPSLLKSRNMETGLTLLESYAPNSAKVVDKINGIMTSAIKYQ